MKHWLKWLWCASLNNIEVGLLSHFSNKIISYEKFGKLNWWGGVQQISTLKLRTCFFLKLEITENPLQSRLHPPSQRVDLTQDRRRASSLELDLADHFHPIAHHFHHLFYILFFIYKLPLISLSLIIRWWICKTKKLKASFKRLYVSTAYQT